MSLILGAAVFLSAYGCNDKKSSRDYDRHDTRYERRREHRADRDESRHRHDDHTRAERRSDRRQYDRDERGHTRQQGRTGVAATRESDASFLKEAAMVNMTEVELAQIALEASESDEVRRYAQRMVTDHRRNQEKLKSLARDLNVELPGQLDQHHRQMVDRHVSLSGEEFDRAYIDMMARDHQKVVSKFERQAKEATNEQVQEYASDTLPTLRSHMRDAQQLDERLARR
jgi:putative membrane protein